ncbi:oxidoreductase [Salinifilum ghardaiensis]
MAHWTELSMPAQHGRTVLITGANSGLGLHSARVLASAGARVLMACRDRERGRSARDQVACTASVEPELVELDLADLTNVREAAAEVRERTGDGVDVLLNNAGVMATPRRSTGDGFELQLGTNHLGHALLTWLLLPALRRNARVVTVSSLAHHRGGLDLSDPNFERRSYSPVRAYGQSKLANLLFMLELSRRAELAGRGLTSAAAHPGMSATELVANTARMRRLPGRLDRAIDAGTRVLTQPVELGVLPQLFAATAPNVQGGDFFGPSGLAELRGYPSRVRMSRRARDPRTAQRLWELTAELVQHDPEVR